MEPIDPLSLVLRWMHIFAAIAAVGGTMYARLALVPSLDVLAPEGRAALLTAIRGRWSKVVMISILFLLVSGLWNFFLVINLFKSAGEKLPPWYHALFGVKFLAALAIFFLASALHGRGAGTQSFRDNARRWLNVALTLSVLLVAISSVMRGSHVAPNSLIPKPVDRGTETAEN